MSKAAGRIEKVTIPAYGIGASEKAPMFLEKSVYPGNSGRIRI